MKRIWSLVVVATTLLAAATALGAEPEGVVVRNRLYNPKHQVELGVEASLSLINRLVSHDNFQITGAFDLTNEWAIEVFGGYALSGHTDVANQVESAVASKSASTTPVDDFSGLWQMQWNAVAGVRWAPIYGKLNLVADLPVHFQAYLAAGAGAAGLTRSSVTYCLSGTALDENGAPTCPNPLVNNRVSPVIHFGGGLRFWMGQHWALRIELRDYTFPDQYQIEIDRQQAATGNQQAGQPVPSAGFESLIFAGLGVSYLF